MKIKLFLAWYDFWIGVYYDRKTGAIYICPLPCIVIKIWPELSHFSFRGTVADGSLHESTRTPQQPDKRIDEA